MSPASFGGRLVPMSILECLLIASSLLSGLWWAFSRVRRTGDLQRLSFAAFVLAAATLHPAIRAERRIAPKGA